MSNRLKNYSNQFHRKRLSSYQFYYKMLKGLVINMFKWNGLPITINEYFLEQTLCDNGYLVYYEKGGICCVRMATAYGLNNNNEPLEYHTLAFADGETEILKPYIDCVPIWNDIDMSNSENAIRYFANKMTALETTISCNLEQIKNPYIITCSEGQKITVEQILKQKTEGVPYVLTDDNINSICNINLFDTHVQNFIPQLEEQQRNIKNEFCTYFGINNVNIFKRERLTSGENDSNNDEILINRSRRLNARQKAIDNINSLYGKNYSVLYNPQVENNLI